MCLVVKATSMLYRSYQKKTGRYNKILDLFEQGNEVEAIDAYIKNSGNISTSFFIKSQKDNIERALKIYKAAKENNALNLYSIVELLRLFQNRNELDKAEYLFDEFFKKLHEMESEQILQIFPSNWKTVIACLCERKRIRDLIEFMDILEKYQVTLHDSFYTLVLTYCVNEEWFELGKKIHDRLLRNGEINIILKNCLIIMYGKCGYLDESIKIFNSIEESEKHADTLTAMISIYGEHAKGEEALRLFSKIQEQGMKLNEITITSVLKACYKSNLIDTADEIFFSMQSKFGIKPNAHHYNCLLVACTNYKLLSLGKKIHQHLLDAKISQDIILKTNLATMYANCGCLEEAAQIFDNIEKFKRSLNVWTTMLAGYTKDGKGEEALKIINEMLEQGLNPDKKLVTNTLKLCCRPNTISNAVEMLFSIESKFGLELNVHHYNCLLITCAEYRLFSLGKRIHKHLLEKNQKADIIFLAHLINLYGGCGFLDEAVKLFNNTQTSERDNIAWTAMIRIYGKFGKGNEALRLFQQTQEEGLKIENSTLTCVLRACAPSKLVNECLEIFRNMVTRYGIKPDLIHCNSIVYVLAKAGLLKEAEGFILNSMKAFQLEPDVITWKNLLTGCRIYLDVDRAEIVSQIILCMNPGDTNVFEALLTIYKKSGNTIKEKQLLTLMKEKGIKRINL